LQLPLRVLIAALVLGVPTTLMGGTLPAVVRAFTLHGRDIARSTSWLYSFNTLGAVCGTLLSAFLLIERLGMQGSVHFAALLNVLAALIALLIPNESKSTAPAAGRAAESYTSLIRDPLVIGFVLSGFIALSYEVLWTRYLIYAMAENSVYAFSLMLAAFLIGITLGSYLAALWIDRAKKLVQLFGMMQILIAASALLSLHLMEASTSPLTSRGTFWELSAARFFKCLAIMLVPTTISGASLAVVARHAARSSQSAGGDIGRIYAFNTIGSICGALTAGWVFLPLLGLKAGFFLLSGMGAAMGIVLILFFSPQKPDMLRVAAVTSAFAFSAVIAAVAANPVTRMLSPWERVIFFEDGPESSIAVIEDTTSGYRKLMVDGDQQMSTQPSHQIHLRMLGHLPPMLHKDPQDALVIALGSGITAAGMLRHPIKSMDIVELSSSVVRSSRFFSEHNDNLLDDRRVTLIKDDGRNFLLTTEKQYDLITTDPLDPDDAGVTNLYSLEFYQLVRERLRPGGVVSHWMKTNYSLSDYKILVRTFQKVFPKMSIWHADFTTVLVGYKDGPAVTLRDFEQRFFEPKVESSWRQMNISDPQALLSFFVAGPEDTEKFLGVGEINTDNAPLIEYRGARYGSALGWEGEIMRPLKEHRTEALDEWFTEWSEKDQSRFSPYFERMTALLHYFTEYFPKQVYGIGLAPSGEITEAEVEEREEMHLTFLDVYYDLLPSSLTGPFLMLLEVQQTDPNLPGERRQQYESFMASGALNWERSKYKEAHRDYNEAYHLTGGLKAAINAAAALDKGGSPQRAVSFLVSTAESFNHDRRAHLIFCKAFMVHALRSVTPNRPLPSELAALLPEDFSSASPDRNAVRKRWQMVLPDVKIENGRFTLRAHRELQ
ncbi:MAG: fused MFS/spermidine synthase, partial [Deltaproteobacteria bacterium]|nr:fused MFS/spermidine synthase [Deltaproteobacteria bacterium]